MYTDEDADLQKMNNPTFSYLNERTKQLGRRIVNEISSRGFEGAASCELLATIEKYYNKLYIVSLQPHHTALALAASMLLVVTERGLRQPTTPNGCIKSRLISS